MMPVSRKTATSPPPETLAPPTGPTGLVPYWTSECGRAVVYLGDNVSVMERLEAQQFHAIVTDPPYGLEFMGNEWDAPWKADGSVDARQRRAAELDDPVKAKYLRHSVTYGGVGSKRRGGGGFSSTQQEDSTGRGSWAFGGTPSSENRVVYGLSDPQAYQRWFLERAAAMMRVAKPGAHLLSFGGTRMWHRMVCAIEDAGFEVRDTIMWVYGTGFPKGTDLGKGIDRLLGAERAPLGKGSNSIAQGQFNQEQGVDGGYGYKADYNVTAPATEAARQWAGWNTALKPALEPIVVARKPPVGSVAANTLEHGCGGINVDGCRVGTEGGTRAVEGSAPDYKNKVYGVGMGGNPKDESFVAGRHPANLIHDGSDEVLDLFPSGAKAKKERTGVRGGSAWHGQSGMGSPDGVGRWPQDEGGSAARFFYSAKADADDRAHMSGAENAHPTVKPLDLMRYLVRLVCARGGTVLDPFLGTGSTGVAAIEEGMYFVGIEQSEDYAKIAVDRLKLALGQHPHMVKRLDTGKVAVVDTPPPPRKLR